MNAKELRLGNIVRIDNPKYHPNVTQPLRVVGIYETFSPNIGEEYTVQLNSLNKTEDATIPLYSQLSCFVKSIPITEELLLKCGFIEMYNNGSMKGFSHEEYLFIDWEISLVTGFGVLSFCDRNVSVVKSLHQLQNLYFSITNKELEVKL